MAAENTKPRVYIETTIPSYLTSRMSRDLVVAARQELTIEWWADHRQRFDLYTSENVIAEAAEGDAEAAARRLEALRGIPSLGFTPEARALAKRFFASGLIPARALEDASHVAIATVHGMDYLVTWNCRHIANGEIMRRLAAITAEFGYELPVLCIPEQLMGD